MTCTNYVTAEHINADPRYQLCKKSPSYLELTNTHYQSFIIHQRSHESFTIMRIIAKILRAHDGSVGARNQFKKSSALVLVSIFDPKINKFLYFPQKELEMYERWVRDKLLYFWYGTKEMENKGVPRTNTFKFTATTKWDEVVISKASAQPPVYVCFNVIILTLYQIHHRNQGLYTLQQRMSFTHGLELRVFGRAMKDVGVMELYRERGTYEVSGFWWRIKRNEKAVFFRRMGEQCLEV